MKEAFIYMFKDNCFWKKAITYFFVSFIACLFISYSQINTCSGMCPVASKPTVISVNSISPIIYQLIGIFINMIVAGYFLSSIKAITSQTSNIVLPFFSFRNNFVKGFKFNLSVFTTIILYSFTFGLLYSFYSTATFAKIGFIILLIFYIFTGVAFVWLFAQEEKFITFFNFKKVIIKIKEDIKNYIKYVLIIAGILLISIAVTFVIELLISNFVKDIIIAMVITTLITTVFATYINFVNMHLIAKSIK